MNRTYIAIDLKSFYASAECVSRGWDPLTTNLVVADNQRGDGTICLAVSPSLKELGVSSRPRLFEAKKTVNELNRIRQEKAPEGILWESSIFKDDLKDPSKEIDFYIATPRMQHYLDVSTHIYTIYLKYVSSQDIHVYSIDEVFIDLTPYLSYYNMSAHDIAMMMIKDVLRQTGITATVGIGSNLFLAKVAMDIVAKHMKPDCDGVRIAQLNEYTFREKLWSHQPITDIWRIGPGISKRLKKYHIHTLGELATFSLEHEAILFKEFGVNAEILIDHAWGRETTLISDIKAYKPQAKSMSSGQVLFKGYSFDQALIIAKEMAHQLSLDMTKNEVQSQLISIWVGYDYKSLQNPEVAKKYNEPIGIDFEGNAVPTSPSCSLRLETYTYSSSEIVEAVTILFHKIVHPDLLVRRIGICACDIISSQEASLEENKIHYEQMDLFTDYQLKDQLRKQHKKKRKDDQILQQTFLLVREKYGKNAIFKGLNLEENATMLERNKQIGGHKA